MEPGEKELLLFTYHFKVYIKHEFLSRVEEKMEFKHSESHLAIKKSKLESFVGTQMHLEATILSEMIQTHAYI